MHSNKLINVIVFIVFCLFQNTPLYAYEPNVTVKVAILDQLMSQKLSSIIYQQDYLKGIEVAAFVAKKQKNINVIYRYFNYSKEPLGIFSAIPKVKAWMPDVIIGPRSSNSMILLKNSFKDILVVSPMATSEKINLLPQNFYSFSLTDQSLAKALYLFSLHQFKNFTAISFVADDCISCKKISTLYLRGLNPKKSLKEFNFISSNVEDFDLTIPLKAFKKNTIIFSPNISYVSSILLARILSYTKSHHLIFVGSDGWGSRDVAYVGKIKSNYQYEAYHTQNWSSSIKTNIVKEFDKYYQQIYGSITSDNVSFASFYSLNKIISLIDTDKLRHCPHKNKCILKRFLAIPNKFVYFKPNYYVIYKYVDDKDKAIAIVNAITWKIQDLT